MEATGRRGQRLGGGAVGLQIEHQLVVGDRGGQRQGVVLVVLILGLLELLRQQIVAVGCQLTPTSGVCVVDFGSFSMSKYPNS